MALRVKHINEDSTFLLIFSPPCAGSNLDGDFPGSYKILIDPWLSGPSKVWNSKFAITHHAVPSCVETLEELPVPDMVIVSQDKTDHCHKATLKQLRPEDDTIILGTHAAAKTIKSWRHFDPDTVHSLKRYDAKREDTLFRIKIPPFSTTGSEGEVTIALMANKMDVTGVHNAIGITYRAPSSALSKSGSYVDLPMTPPATPPTSPDSSGLIRSPTSSIIYPASTTLYPAPYGNREKCLSVLYSPHGCSYDVVKPYATSHLLAEAALPLTALFHSWNRATNPWFLGGNICGGFPDGVDIALHLFARIWISAHDEEKDTSIVEVYLRLRERWKLVAHRGNVEKGHARGVKCGRPRRQSVLSHTKLVQV